MILLVGLALGVARWEGPTSGAAVDEADHLPRSIEPRIDINTAPLRTLNKVLGIGPELAERIVQHRPYKKLDELITRKVLGRKQFARIKDKIRIGSASTESVSQ
ncbi:MAG: ComEA family DNA-binding protein [Candidatus Methylomirabilis sp.]